MAKVNNFIPSVYNKLKTLAKDALDKSSNLNNIYAKTLDEVFKHPEYIIFDSDLTLCEFMRPQGEGTYTVLTDDIVAISTAKCHIIVLDLGGRRYIGHLRDDGTLIDMRFGE
jgi:hypothetical protein|nr:MAG TPA: hypothetical protein [Caudoviricetes sp.]